MSAFRHIESRNPYRHLLFRRGFFAACSGDIPVVHGHWTNWSDRRFGITYDPSVPFCARTSDQHLVAVLGTFVSHNHETIDHDNLTNILFQALVASAQEFFSEMDACCGRFVCFFSTGGTVQVMNDACGMRMVHYATSCRPSVSSHAYLLAHFLSKSQSNECRNFCQEAKPAIYNMAFLPGHATIYSDVRILSPNTHLDLFTGDIKRFFPRETLSPVGLPDAVETAADILSDLAGKFDRMSRLAVSLTAGLDSRLTTAALRNVCERAQFFTYLRAGEKVNAVDAVVARRIAKQHRLHHHLVHFDYEAPEMGSAPGDFAAFRRVARYCVEFEHFFPLAYAYLKHYPSDLLHLRSNIGEICRARYHATPFDRLTRNEKTILGQLTAIYKKWTGAADHPFIEAQFQRYIDENEIASGIYGYDWRALYYWEHLMPVWQGSLLLESDLSHETVSLFNCRIVLTAFLSAPFADQVSTRVMIDVINRLSPSMLHQPINPSIEELDGDEIQPFLPGM